MRNKRTSEVLAHLHQSRREQHPYSHWDSEHYAERFIVDMALPFAKKSGKVESFESYEQVLIGFPIWYGCAPNVVNTFCARYDWTGKRVLAFATSGGSPIGKTAEKLRPYVQGAASVEAVLVKDAAELANR